MKISRVNIRKVNRLIKTLSKELEQLTNCLEINNVSFNGTNMILHGLPLCMHLKHYINENIFFAYGLAKYAKTDSEKMFFCNYLCVLLYAFIELYAQSLNVYYDLDLQPMRKKVNYDPLISDGIVEQTKQDLSKTNGAVVSIENVINQLKKDYQENEYFIQIQEELTSDEIKRLKDLRNNQVHYQSILGRYHQSYTPGKANCFVFDVHPNCINKREYDEFLKLSEVIIHKEIGLIKLFYGMIFDKKMILKGQKEEELCVVKCKECGKELLIPERTIVFLKALNMLPSIKHNDGCRGVIDLTINERIKVHPEQYCSCLYELMQIIGEMIECENLEKV